MNGGTRAEMKKHSSISVGNWLWTIALSLIPGVNIISFIVWIIASKTPTKRNYAIAALIVLFLLIVLYLVAIMFFSDPILRFFSDAKNVV